ncbi:MAG: prolipoprotein diacylglyceryl transferase, partial [Bdellovibrionaceae bacterium]|nr:prolipoprotein diacylglyceryl transferase [Pseudobdellovibrionaceae bacterium]
GRGSDWQALLQNMGTDIHAREQVNRWLHTVVEKVYAGDGAVKAAIAPVLDGRYPSQLIAAAGEGLLVFLVLLAIWYRPRRPGIVGASFVITYALVRILTETVRQPDAHIGFQLLGLTRGQWLSIAQLIIGVLLLIWWSRSSQSPVLGWGRLQTIKIGRNR